MTEVPTPDEIAAPKWSLFGTHCVLCAKPFASDEDRVNIPEGEGGHLCWAEWGGCDGDGDGGLDLLVRLRGEIEALAAENAALHAQVAAPTPWGREANALTEPMRRALMAEHADDWDMDTVSEAAHICSAVAAEAPTPLTRLAAADAPQIVLTKYRSGWRALVTDGDNEFGTPKPYATPDEALRALADLIAPTGEQATDG